MATTLPWHPLLSPKPLRIHHTHKPITTRRTVAPVRAFGRGDFDRFAKRMASGEVWRDVLRSTNDGFEQLVYETKKTAERIDRRFSVSRRLSAVAQSASYHAREIDRDLEITQRLRTFSLDFSYNWPRIMIEFNERLSAVAQSASYRAREIDRDLEIMQRLRTFSLDFSYNWPRYRKQLNDFWNTPLGRSFATIFFIWFALSGWMFRFLIFGTWILPFAGPLLIGTVANSFIIKGSCPACKKQFAGYKNQIVRCTSCGNIVWQPQGDFFSRGGRGTTPSSSKSDPEIIDVDFEEK